eukprot:m.72803 g.72803  ORF g.72803 m.72803 type:complete len:170 (+) comp35816_c0_seq1:487-996(+)
MHNVFVLFTKISDDADDMHPKFYADKYALLQDMDNETIYLHDAGQHQENILAGKFRMTIIVSSPDDNHYRSYCQQWSVRRLYMPVWTKDDIKKCISITKPTTCGDWEELYEFLGGIPRLIFSLTVAQAKERMKGMWMLLVYDNWFLMKCLMNHLEQLPHCTTPFCSCKY